MDDLSKHAQSTIGGRKTYWIMSFEMHICTQPEIMAQFLSCCVSFVHKMYFSQSHKAALFLRFFFTINDSLIPSFLAFSKVEFVTAVTAGGSINFCQRCKFLHFTHLFVFFVSLKLLKLGEIDSVNFLAWKSGGVKFLTNSMSVLSIFRSNWTPILRGGSTSSEMGYEFSSTWRLGGGKASPLMSPQKPCVWTF